jgi:hypothetical protein
MIPKDPAQLALFIQSYSGVGLFFLFFIQILVGRFVKKSGLYYLLTFLLVGLVLTHIFAYIYYVKIIKGFFDPFYPFTDLCLLCKTIVFPEYFINFGRIALWLVGLTSLAIFTRFKNLRWLNMIAFLSASFHVWFLGKYVRVFPLNYLLWGMVVIVAGLLLQRLQQFIQSAKKRT